MAKIISFDQIQRNREAAEQRELKMPDKMRELGRMRQALAVLSAMTAELERELDDMPVTKGYRQPDPPHEWTAL